MTRRRVLNITTKKKRDAMQPLSYNSDTGVPTNTARPGVGITLQGGKTNMLLWCPTARDLTDPGGTSNAVTYESGRTSSTVYLRLLAEKIRMSTSDSTPWIWRRIVVSTKNPAFRALTSAESAGGKNPSPYIETSDGYQRLLQQWDNTGGNLQTQNLIFGDIFRGGQGRDWSDPITAPIDTLRVTKHYDKTTTIRSGNDSGTYRVTRRTHPFNRTFRYDEDEQGQFQSSSVWSSTGKGMGDVYIIDLFSNFIGGTTSLLKFEPEAMLYWHER